jgi:hypothetical protein
MELTMPYMGEKWSKKSQAKAPNAAGKIRKRK